MSVLDRGIVNPHFLSAVLVAGLLGGAQGLVSAHLTRWKSAEMKVIRSGSIEDVGVRYEPTVARVLSFGHWPAMVDWLWIRALTDPSVQPTQRVPKGGRAKIYFDLDLATDLDPAFFDIYVAGAQLLAIVKDDAPAARDLLLKAEAFRNEKLPFSYHSSFKQQYWQTEWRVPLLLAYLYLFELDDIRAAAKYFTEASRISGSPTYLKSLARRFEKSNGIYEVAGRLLRFLLESTSNEDARIRLLERQASLELGIELQTLNRSFAQFRSSPQGKRLSAEAAWSRFLTLGLATSHDSRGGKLSLNSSGRIVSATPRVKVFGLE